MEGTVWNGLRLPALRDLEERTMRIFYIQRLPWTPLGVFGNMSAEEIWDGIVYRIPFAVTVEHPKLHVPKGEYSCPLDFYHRGNYPTYLVPAQGRSRILLHKGNIAWDDPATPEDDAEIVGCVAVAEKFGVLRGRAAILESSDGFNEFMSKTNKDPMIKLVIE